MWFGGSDGLAACGVWFGGERGKGRSAWVGGAWFVCVCFGCGWNFARVATLFLRLCLSETLAVSDKLFFFYSKSRKSKSWAKTVVHRSAPTVTPTVT